MPVKYDETREHLVHIIENLSSTMSSSERYQSLLDCLARLFPCDAACLLKLEGPVLNPVAIIGLSTDTLGRRFKLDSNPRLSQILDSTLPVQFPADSDLPDPFDGLVTGHQGSLKVHDCVGIRLMVDNQPWGVLTLDALNAGSMNEMPPESFRTAIATTGATVKMVSLIDQLESRVEKEQALNQTLLDEQAGRNSTEMIGNSASMTTLKNDINVVASSDLSVLILGETGTGKELVASQLHQHSKRNRCAMVHINCAALPDNIVESELFGHVRGAFTGAVKDRQGKFEQAHQGTLFLDEVGELPLATQVKLLRVLQNGEIQRVGSEKQIKVDVRIIAATNRDLATEVRAGQFRTDLYHRLSVFPIYVPPLRERETDVLLLAGFFMEQNRLRLALEGLRMSDDCRRVLMEYHWPGNIRELEHTISRASLKAMSNLMANHNRIVTIHPDHLNLSNSVQVTITESSGNPMPPSLIQDDSEIGSMRESVDNFQRQLISQLMERHNDNWTVVAQQLDIDRGNLHRLAKRLELKK